MARLKHHSTVTSFGDVDVILCAAAEALICCARTYPGCSDLEPQYSSWDPAKAKTSNAIKEAKLEQKWNRVGTKLERS